MVVNICLIFTLFPLSLSPFVCLSLPLFFSLQHVSIYYQISSNSLLLVLLIYVLLIQKLADFREVENDNRLILDFGGFLACNVFMNTVNLCSDAISFS